MGHRHYEYVKSQEGLGVGPEDPCGLIQWKGTDVCIDVHCKCGWHGHVDAEFFYSFTCPGCGTVWAVGSVVRLVELTDPEHIADAVDACHTTFDQ